MPDRAQAFEELLEPVLDVAYRIAYYLTRNPDEARSLVQEAALRAFRSFHTFRAGTNFKAWFSTILTNAFREECRRRKRHPEPVNLDEAPDLFLYRSMMTAGASIQDSDPAAEVIGSLRSEQVAEALERLPEEYRTVCTLYFVQELTYPEIAEIVGCPIGTIRSRLHRGRKILQRALWELAQASGLAV